MPLTLLALLLLCLTAFPSLSPAFELPPPQGFHPALSLQGFTGILNTPSAHVTQEGDFYALYTNQKENNWRKRVPFQDNYLFSVGMFNFIEIGGRFFEAPGAGRDLSANVKVTSAPLTRDYPLLPVIAAGMQDIGGGAKFFQTKYVVASEDIWRLRLSLGYGSGPDRMKGAFAGAEFKAHDWFYLLGEYDTRETNAGIRVVLPQFWRVPFSFTATAKTSLDHKPGNFDVAVGFSVPLDFRMQVQGSRFEVRGSTETESVQALKPNVQSSTTSTQTANPEHQTSHLTPRTSNAESRASGLEPRTSYPVSETSNPEPRTSNLESLRDRLIRQGFLNVRVGSRERILVVEYENARFNHNELDALGAVAGIACSATTPGDFDAIRIVVRRHDIAMIQLSAPLSTFRTFLDGDGDSRALREALDISYRIDTAGVEYLGGDRNPGMLSTSLSLYPALATWVGTEFGVFDYLLSLKTDLFVQGWQGAVVNARWDTPISWSDNLEEGKQYQSSRSNSRMERLMLFQGIRLLPDVMANVGAGMVLHDIYGTLNEVVWQPGDGAHRVRLAQSWSRHDKTHRELETWLASYRYYYSPLDLSLEGTAGKFFSQDRGFALELKRMFGDTALSVYYKNSTTTDKKHWEAAGIQFAFPLTPRRDLQHYYKMQLRGSDEWAYAQETTLKNLNNNDGRGALNYIAPVPLAINPQPPTALYRAYFNRDRLGSAYIKSHLERLREAWLIYKD
ncbi:MAG: YjbH domain-containing protein [Deltaproteobacteria bacterium]|nr:YjbH domain-containing protein [Deltaproteobacteria bacterium]